MGIFSKISEHRKNVILVFIGLIVSLVATLGSLYFSEIVKFRPCKLCWFQRILTYPQVIIFGAGLVASRLSDFDFRMTYLYGLILSIIASSIAAYHSYIQLAPEGELCTGTCSIVLYRAFGVFSIPNQSLIANLILLTVSAVGLYITTRR